MISDCQTSVYGSQPVVCNRTVRPSPRASAGRSSSTPRYTDGHHCGSDNGSPRTSAPSPHVPSTRQCEMKWYSFPLILRPVRQAQGRPEPVEGRQAQDERRGGARGELVEPRERSLRRWRPDLLTVCVEERD